MAEVNTMQSTTMKTYLGKSSDGSNFTKLVPIKDFPDLGGAPDQVESTTLDDEQQTFLLGVKSIGQLEFTCNYVPADYDTVKTLCDGTIKHWCVAFGDTGEYGVFSWDGQCSVWVTGGGVNAVREMKISISAATEIKKEGTFTIGA